ncbi:MAG: dethiobiotin synthase, partial [Proteobacteria bacterium]|nr:dethiobiotin synthase [Pseudomonadota bacterium]
NVTAVKPIETGCKKSKGELIPADGKVYQKLLREKIELIVPYRYQLAVAPMVAAKKEKRTISIKKIKKLILEKAKNHSLVLVEGAGGLLVPITEDYSFADLAKDLQAKCLVVVGSRLGAINQALLTFEVLKNRKIKTLGYILNEPYKNFNYTNESDRPALKTNRDLLKQLSKQYGLKEISYIKHQ